MKVIAHVRGTRADREIEVPVSSVAHTEHGHVPQVQFWVPSVARSAGCIFELDISELREALDFLAPVGGMLRGQIGETAGKDGP